MIISSNTTADVLFALVGALFALALALVILSSKGRERLAKIEEWIRQEERRRNGP